MGCGERLADLLQPNPPHKQVRRILLTPPEALPDSGQLAAQFSDFLPEPSEALGSPDAGDSASA